MCKSGIFQSSLPSIDFLNFCTFSLNSISAGVIFTADGLNLGISN